MTKRKGTVFTMQLTVVGLGFRWKAHTIGMMPGWCPFPVTLEREPDNRRDPNAIKVLMGGDKKLAKLKGVHFGYLRATIAEMLADRIDSGAVTPIKLWVTDIDVEAGQATVQARFRKRPPTKRKQTKRATKPISGE